MVARRIGERAMTPAERKARSRALALGGVVAHLDQADAALRRVQTEVLAALNAMGAGNPVWIRRVSPDLAEAIEDLDLHLGLAREFLPRS